VEDMSYVFCSKPESCTHVFFTYTIASEVWSELNRLMGKPSSPMSFESVLLASGLVTKRIVLKTMCMQLFYGFSGLLGMILILTKLHGLVYRSCGEK
jgi:hypothetical protein